MTGHEAAATDAANCTPQLEELLRPIPEAMEAIAVAAPDPLSPVDPSLEPPASFPSQISLGGRAAVRLESEIDVWFAQQIASSREAGK